MMGTASGLEEAYRQAQDMINRISRIRRDGQLEKSSLNQKNFHSHSKQSIHSKLTRLYFEELSKAPHATPDSVLNNLENECDLLGRLAQREGLHTLIVNLYAGNKGYSLAVRNTDKSNQFEKNSLLAETQLMGYEQGELLSCIDNGQLPAMLAEQLEPNNSHLFYDGCIVAEVRDYRKNVFHGKPDVHHVLLKPTTQSILSDVSTLTSDGDWSHEERLLLESRLIEATQGPLCLDPNPVASLASTRLHQSQTLLTDNQLQRQAKKFSQVTVNRKRKLEHLSTTEGITIQELMQRIRNKKGQQQQKITTACPPPCLNTPPLLPPTTPVDVLNYAKAYERPRETKDCLPQLIEEYILETERGQGRVYHIKLSILQRPSNSEYLGELYVDRDYKDGEKNGSSCRFTLGTRVQANHYMQQFTEIFTEEGRKNVRIKHVVPGQPPRVTCTPGMQRAQQQAAQAAQLAQQLQQAQTHHVAQQILSRAQGQLNNLAGQVVAAAAAAVAANSNVNTGTNNNQIDQTTSSSTSSSSSSSSSASASASSTSVLASQLTHQVQQPIIQTNQSLDNNNILTTTTTTTGQPLTNGSLVPSTQTVPAPLSLPVPVPVSVPSSSVTSVIDASTLIDNNNPSVNGSPGILVFQPKPTSLPVNNSVSNVPVLQAQLQAGTQSGIIESNNQSDSTFKKHSTNPAISALVTSLMNSAQQFQQQAAAAAALNNSVQQQTPPPPPPPPPPPSQAQSQAQPQQKTNNAAILSLLNSSPANLTQKNQTRRISLNASIPQRVIGHGNVITVPSTTGQVRVSFSSALTNQLTGGKQQSVKATAVRLARVQDNTSTLGLSMPGLSALLAGTPSADNPIPGINNASSLLERLTASSSQTSQPNSPMTSPPPPQPSQPPPSQTPTNVNLQSVNLTSLPNTINGLQNVQVSFPGLSQPITMPLNVTAAAAAAASVTPTGVIVSLPISSGISSGTNICTTVSSMVAPTVVTTAVAGSTPTVVIANPANTHLSLPIAQIIPSGVKGLAQQNIRNTNTIALSQGGQAIQLVGSQRPRLNQMTRQVRSNQVKSTVLPNQLVTVAKTVTASQLILSGNKQVITPIMATKPVLMANQTTPSSQAVPAHKHTLLTKSLHARTGVAGQTNTQSIGVTSLSQQQIQQLQHCLKVQHNATVAAGSSPNRTQIQARNSTSAPGDESI